MTKAQEYIKNHPYLIWWVKKYDQLDNEAIVEAILNYGDWDDVEFIIKTLGMKKVATIFRAQTDPGRMRCNYYKLTKNYFTLYFNRYA
ncbi:hypothetical protein GW889_02700 [Candidatus Berkelbacteria bacterium]|nr:hypothetical protein [Candidatus Berkelbacteria bacterium]